MAGGRRAKGGKGPRRESRAQERLRLLEVARGCDMPAHADVCVVGGGAAGLAAAISAKEAGAARVVVLERDAACGRSILATGNGRCNFANKDLASEHYNHSEFVAAAMGEPEAAGSRILGFFAECGLAWVEEEGRLYPRSRQAASVRNVLLARCWRDGVCLAPARELVGAVRRHGRWYLSFVEGWSEAEDGSIVDEPGYLDALTCDSLVFACGGGSSALAAELGLPLVAERPVLCGVSASAPVPGPLDALDGRRAHCVASLTRGGRVVMREAGEVLFRPGGLSGILSFNLSREARSGDLVELDLAPEIDAWEVDHLVASRPGDSSALDGILDPVIAAELLSLAGGIGADGLAWRVAPLVKGLPFRVSGLLDAEHAQVTRGGIDVLCVNPATMAVHIGNVMGAPSPKAAAGNAPAKTCGVLDQASHQHLYACGEALDVDGACGGYNLAWAWVSGLVAGESAARNHGERA